MAYKVLNKVIDAHVKGEVVSVFAQPGQSTAVEVGVFVDDNFYAQLSPLIEKYFQNKGYFIFEVVGEQEIASFEACVIDESGKTLAMFCDSDVAHAILVQVEDKTRGG
jgi:hypothetical protein